MGGTVFSIIVRQNSLSRLTTERPGGGEGGIRAGYISQNRIGA